MSFCSNTAISKSPTTSSAWKSAPEACKGAVIWFRYCEPGKELKYVECRPSRTDFGHPSSEQCVKSTRHTDISSPHCNALAKKKKKTQILFSQHLEKLCVFDQIWLKSDLRGVWKVQGAKKKLVKSTGQLLVYTFKSYPVSDTFRSS